MAYVYSISFDVAREHMNELQIGASLERVLGFLRTLLPNEAGYMSSRAMYSVEQGDTSRLVFESVWQEWRDLKKHRESGAAEDKVLLEFHPHLEAKNIEIQTFVEVD